MCLALIIAKMAKEGFLCAAIEETQQLIKKPSAEVRQAKMRSVVFRMYNGVKDAIGGHTAMVRENQTDGSLPCQNGTAPNLQTRWRRKGTGAPPPQLAPPRPRTPPAPPDDSEKTQSSDTEGVPPRYVYIHTPLHSAHFCNLDPYAKDRMRHNNFFPDLLTDEGQGTG